MTKSDFALNQARVLVIGGGVGGMTFALRAAQHGAHIEIVEADPQWRVAGAGITITGPTFRAIKRLGLLEEVVAKGFYIDTGAIICAPDGSPVGEVPMRSLEPGLPTNGGILRPRLHDIMASQVKAQGVRVTLGQTVKALEDQGERVSATISDGRTEDFDLVVVADGAFSPTRSIVFPEAPVPSYTGQYCWRILARRPSEIRRPHFYMDGKVTCGVMPVNDEQMYLWLLENAPERRRLADEDLPDLLRGMLAPFAGAIDAVREAIDAGAPIIARPLDAVLLPLPWHKGRTILIGDAVHATTPHLASGAGIAIEDGMLLADMLAESGDPIAAFERFEARRYERCRLVVEDSVAIGHMQQTAASPEALNQRMSRAQAALAAEI